MNVTIKISNSIAEECIIKASKRSKIPCIFPFKWNGKEYRSCVFKKDGSWCSTMVDDEGNHIQKYWGKCPSDCKTDKSLIYQKSRSRAGE